MNSRAWTIALVRSKSPRRLDDREGDERATRFGPPPGEGGLQQRTALMTCIALATAVLTAGVFLSLLYFWAGIHREFHRAEPAPQVERAPEVCAMSEFQPSARPTGCEVMF